MQKRGEKRRTVFYVHSRERRDLIADLLASLWRTVILPSAAGVGYGWGQRFFHIVAKGNRCKYFDDASRPVTETAQFTKAGSLPRSERVSAPAWPCQSLPVAEW